jgi:hypothetical protein
MENRPFTKLFISLAVFATVACILAEFRHGFDVPALFCALVGTLGSAACLDRFIWPAYNGKSGCFVLFLDFILAASFTAYAFLVAFDLPRSHWLLELGLAICLLRGFCYWRGRRRLNAESLQARLLQKHHDHAA